MGQVLAKNALPPGNLKLLNPSGKYIKVYLYFTCEDGISLLEAVADSQVFEYG